MGGYLLGSLLILTLSVKWELTMLGVGVLFLLLIVKLSLTVRKHEEMIFPQDQAEMERLED